MIRGKLKFFDAKTDDAGNVVLHVEFPPGVSWRDLRDSWGAALSNGIGIEVIMAPENMGPLLAQELQRQGV